MNIKPELAKAAELVGWGRSAYRRARIWAGGAAAVENRWGLASGGLGRKGALYGKAFH